MKISVAGLPTKKELQRDRQRCNAMKKQVDGGRLPNKTRTDVVAHCQDSGKPCLPRHQQITCDQLCETNTLIAGRCRCCRQSSRSGLEERAEWERRTGQHGERHGKCKMQHVRRREIIRTGERIRLSCRSSVLRFMFLGGQFPPAMLRRCGMKLWTGLG